MVQKSYSLSIDNLPHAFAHLKVLKEEDPLDFLLLYSNPAFQEMTGLTRDMIEKRPISSFKSGILHTDQLKNALERVAKTGESISSEYISLGTMRYEVTIYPQEGGDLNLLFKVSKRDEEASLRDTYKEEIDIDKEERAEQMTLRDYQRIIASIPGAIFRCVNKKEWTILSMSETIEELTGYPASIFTGQRLKTFRDMIYEKDQDFVIDSIQSQVERDGSYHVHYRILTENKTMKWIHESGQGIYHKEGELLYMDSIVIDITRKELSRMNKEREIEEDLSHSHKRLLTIMNSIEALVYVADCTTKEILFINAHGRMIWGDVVGERCQEIFECHKREKRFCPNRELAHDTTCDSLLWEYYNPKIQRWYDCKDRLIEWIDGRRVRLHIAIDITDRKEAEEELRRGAERYRTLINVSHTGAWEYHQKEDYLECSPEYFSMLGRDIRDFSHTEKNSLEKRWIDLLHPEDRETATRHFAKYLENGSVGMYENYFRMQHSNGEWIWILSRGRTLQDADGDLTNITLGTHIDITHYKEVEEHLKELVKEREELYRQLEEEIQKARDIHEVTLPQPLLQVEGITIDSYYRPAKKLGGDFYYAMRKENRLIIYLSDVAGHGMDGAMLSLFVKYTIDSYISLSPSSTISAQSIMEYLNHQYRKENFPEEYLICIYIVVLNLETLSLQYLGAGFQDVPLLGQMDGSILPLYNSTLPISALIPKEMMKLEEKTITLEKGSTLLFHTDGLTEQMVGERRYGDRLRRVFTENHIYPPTALVYSINKDFSLFNANSLQGDDDITFLVMQIHPDREVHSLEIGSKFHQLESLRSWVLKILPEEEREGPLLTCIHELAANAIEHGNRFHKEKRVLIEIERRETYQFVTIEDEGGGFPWREKIESHMKLDSQKERGRGIALTSLLAHLFFYNHKGNKAYLLIKPRSKRVSTSLF